MTILQAILLGIIEGLTEFLPVSSTGHLIVAAQWLRLEQNDANAAFEVIIQLAAILAVVANYRKRFTPAHFDLWLKVSVAFLPIGFVGLLFHQQIKSLFTVPIVASMFVAGGVVFLLLEYFSNPNQNQTREVDDLSFRQAGWVGLAQVFALIPGTSRAGASIVGGLLVGMNRKASAEFSFLLALPVLASAAALDIYKHIGEFSNANLTALAVGFATAFLVALLSMKLFIGFLERFTFVGFGVYRIVFGLLLLWFWY